MKKSIYCFLLLMPALFGKTQVMPEAFLDKFPTPPHNACEMNSAQRQEYLDRVQAVSLEIREVIDQLNEEMEAREPEMEQQAMNKMARQYGLSSADMQKLQSGTELSEQDQKALVDKMMRNSVNISLTEVENLKKMDEEGREAWAQAYSAEVATDAQVNPGKYKNQQLETKSLYELTELQKHLMDSLTAVETSIGKRFIDICNNSEAVDMREEINQLEKERMSMIGIGSEDKMVAVTDKIRSLKRTYCNKFTPANTAVIQDYRTHTESSLPVYYRLEEIHSELIKAQAGIDMKMRKGHLALGKVESLGDVLLRAFDYNLFTGFDEE